MSDDWELASLALRERFIGHLTREVDRPEYGFWRFHDAPPALVRDVLAGCDPLFSDYQPNGQPPPRWLVQIADRLGGLLAGSPSMPGGIRVDAICVPGPRGPELAQAVRDDWPEVLLDALPLDLALAEAWTSWDAERSIWEGPGRALLEPRSEPVVGLWWD